MYNFDLSQEAQKLLAKVEMQSLFYYGNCTFKIEWLIAFEPKSKLYNSFESADVWYYLLPIVLFDVAAFLFCAAPGVNILTRYQ